MYSRSGEQRDGLNAGNGCDVEDIDEIPGRTYFNVGSALAV